MKNLVLRASQLMLALVLLASLGLSSCKKSDSSTTVNGNWTRGNSFPGTTRNGAVSFIINNVAYVGTGIDANSNKYKDFYSFAPTTGSWTKLTSMPAAAVARYNAVAFVAGGKGYVGTGYDGTNMLSDFWQFDPAGTTTTTTTTGTTVTTTTTSGSWKQVADLTTVSGGTARYGAVAGNVSDIGYVGCGFDGNYQKDFYRYNPAANTWSTFAGFPGDKRMGALAFTINGQMYVGTGINNGLYTTDFWSYNPAGDTWTRKHDLANISNSTGSYDNSALPRAYASSFVVGNLGYVTVGSNTAVRTDCFAYDPTLDTWTATNPFKGAGRNSGVSFGIGNYGYVGTGYAGSTRFDDFWQFDPNAAQE
jgi:N-acetylneuraminic acid mutarotase